MLHEDITAADAKAMHSVEDRVIIVTGSAQGVGRGMAHHLGKSGATVVVADYQADKLQRTCDELTKFGAPNLGVEVDIQGRDQIDAMVARTVETSTPASRSGRFKIPSRTCRASRNHSRLTAARSTSSPRRSRASHSRNSANAVSFRRCASANEQSRETGALRCSRRHRRTAARSKLYTPPRLLYGRPARTQESTVFTLTPTRLASSDLFTAPPYPNTTNRFLVPDGSA